MINLETTTALGALFVVAALGAALATHQEPRVEPVEVPLVEEAPIAYLSSTDVDCIGKARCLSEAEFAYDLAGELMDNVNADISNRYMAYKHLMRARALLAKGGLTVPQSMVALPTHRAELEAELDVMFRQSRVNFHNNMKRKNYTQAVRELRIVKAKFPEQRSRYHLWALEKERRMRVDGIHPTKRVW